MSGETVCDPMCGGGTIPIEVVVVLFLWCMIHMLQCAVCQYLSVREVDIVCSYELGHLHGDYIDDMQCIHWSFLHFVSPTSAV